MIYALVNMFTKITAYPIQLLCFRIKVYYEDKKDQGRYIKGPAIIVSNHTSVFDYAAYIFVFFFNTLRYQMAEVLFKKRVLGVFLKLMGGIYLDRHSLNNDYMSETLSILNKNGIVGIFPEGRLPLKGETVPLQFKNGAVKLALLSNAKIIPLYTNGFYFNKKRTRVVIGKAIMCDRLYDDSLDERTNLDNISNYLRDKVIQLERLIDEKSQ